MRIERTRDMVLVKQIMSHPSIFKHITEDGITEPTPIDHDGLYWMLAMENEEPAGLFLVHQRSTVCYEMHTMILPEYWGEKASEAAQKLLEWAFTAIKCLKMVTSVPEYNRAALRFAIANGMKNEGVNRQSFLRNGKLIDQINLGITRKDWESCQQQLSRQ